MFSRSNSNCVCESINYPQPYPNLRFEGSVTSKILKFLSAQDHHRTQPGIFAGLTLATISTDSILPYDWGRVHAWNPTEGVIVVKLAEGGVWQLEALDLSSLKVDRFVGRKILPIAQVG